jgi:hypothetical protein
MAHQSLSVPSLDFTCRHRKLKIFGAEHVLPAPAMARNLLNSDLSDAFLSGIDSAVSVVELLL